MDSWRSIGERRYHQLVLDNGVQLTVFCDRVAGGWFEQRY